MRAPSFPGSNTLTGRKATYARYFIEKDFLRLANAELGTERVTNFIEAVLKFEVGE